MSSVCRSIENVMKALTPENHYKLLNDFRVAVTLLFGPMAIGALYQLSQT